MKRVIVVDDEPITRMDLRGMLGDLGFEVAGEAGDGFDAVEVCRRLQPDVVLMDVKMPVFDGINAAETILQQDLAGCVVLLTAYGDREIIDRASAAGVTGYIVKPVEERLLLPTIEVALAQSQRLRQSREETRRAVYQAVQQLSPLDREIITLYYYGQLSLKEVGAAMGITPGAARTMLCRARKKLKGRLEGMV